MDAVDLLLAPVYMLFLYLFFRRKRKKIVEPVLKKYHLRAFWIKILGCILFVIYYSYFTLGDTTTLYHTEGNNLYHLILDNSNNIKYLFKRGEDFDLSLVKNQFNRGYFPNEGNFMIIRLDAIFSFFTFGRYILINLLFAAIAFSGLWKLFLFFYEQKPGLHKAFAISILFFPSVVFWSSGLLKDSLCIAALGWFTYAGYELLIKRKSILKNLLIISISAYLLAIIKVYILLAYIPFFSIFILLKNLQFIKFKLLKYLLVPILVALCSWGFIQYFLSNSEALGAYALEDVASSISNMNSIVEGTTGNADAASNFSLGAEFDGTLPGLVKIAPAAVVATFFRPFIWEAHKISQLMAALESLLLMGFTLVILFKSKIIGSVKWLFTDPLIMYSFFFAVVFGVFVGASTLNFGTLVRYKIPCLPFFTISLFLIYEKVKEKQALKKMQQPDVSNETSLLPYPQ